MTSAKTTLLTLSLVALIVLSGCGDPEPQCIAPCEEPADTLSADAGADTSEDTTGEDAAAEDATGEDAARDTSDDDGSSVSFSVAATEETANTFHTVDVSGSGGSVIGDVEITDNVGTVSVHGQTLDAFSYRRIPWPSENRTLYQTLVVAPDALYVLWFYCSDGGDLREIWFEGTDGTALEYENGSGSCGGEQTPTESQVSFPAVNMELAHTDGGFTVSGTDVVIGANGTGTTTFFDTTYETYVFDQVDCSVQCNTSDGWYELHVLMWNEEDAELYFGIFYLMDGGSTVRLSYTIGLPSLFEPGQQQFSDATWMQN